MKKKSIKLLVALSMLQGLAGKAYATAFMVMGYEKAMEVLAKNPTITAYFILADDAHEGGYKVVCNNLLISQLPEQ